MKKILIKIVMLTVPIIMLNCSSTALIVKPIPNNPTSYVFNANIERVKEAVKSAFYKLGYRFGDLDFLGDEYFFSVDAKKILNKKGNENDFYFYDGFFPESVVYFKKNQKPLPFDADFHIHITSVNSTGTKVEIFTINPRVEIGKSLLPTLPHFAHTLKFKSVAPTTIEEYEILLKIGEYLEVKEKMPKLIKP